MAPKCNRIHLGPVDDGSLTCRCCGKVMDAGERLRYWSIQVQVRRMIYECNVKLLEYLQKRTAP